MLIILIISYPQHICQVFISMYVTDYHTVLISQPLKHMYPETYLVESLTIQFSKRNLWISCDPCVHVTQGQSNMILYISTLRDLTKCIEVREITLYVYSLIKTIESQIVIGVIDLLYLFIFPNQTSQFLILQHRIFAILYKYLPFQPLI